MFIIIYNMQYTFSLFRQFYNSLSPLVPKEIKESMFSIIKDWEKHPDIGIEEIESVMIKFGYEVWPYTQAYKEFLLMSEEKMGEKFLLGFLNPILQNKFLDFKIYGGTFQDLRVGNASNFFEVEDRVELCEALVGTDQAIKDFTKQEVICLKKNLYLEKINEFKKVLKNVQKEIKHLYKLASEEEDHPSLAREIKETAKGFEHSLCLLGVELNHFAVCNSVEFFGERKKHLNNLHGIHEVVEVDFYS